MTETEQKNKMFDLFNQEQGTFIYYTCGLLVAMIGYSFNVVYESAEPHLILPLIGILTMLISLSFGLYFIKYRLSNYRNNANLLHIRDTNKEEWKREVCKEVIEENGKKQSFWYKLHWWSIGVGPIIMFIWLIIISL